VNAVKIGILAAVVLLMGWLLAADFEAKTDAAKKKPIERPAARAPLVPTPPGRTYMGMGMQLYNVHDHKQRYLDGIREIASWGASAVLFSAAGSQEHAESNAIYLERERVPSESDLIDLIDEAHRLELAVVLMPIVLFTNPRNNEWRGEIQPDDWDEWFASYLAFVNFFARIGAQQHVEVLMIGSELISTEKFTGRWRRLIAELRKTFPGQLAYSANWDHYKAVRFWDDLDLIGMTTYHTLSDKPNPDLSSLVDAWRPIKKRILTWRQSINLPLLFTEVGWCSQDGATTAPWNYYHQKTEQATETGLIEQESAYEAFIATWRDEPNMAGAIWWEFKPWSAGRSDSGYDPRGKPAMKRLKKWFAHFPREPKIDEDSGAARSSIVTSAPATRPSR
jgi:hypothetical protein